MSFKGGGQRRRRRRRRRNFPYEWKHRLSAPSGPLPKRGLTHWQTNQPTDQPTNQLSDGPIKRGVKSCSTQQKIASLNQVFTVNQMSSNRVKLALWKPVKILDQRNLVVKSEMLLVKSGDRNVVVHCMLTHYENKLFQRKVLYWKYMTKNHKK